MSPKFLVSIVLLVTCLFVVDSQWTHMGPDGKMHYDTPLPCSYGSLYYTEYDRVRSMYTLRNDQSCCTLVDSRNNCCVDNRDPNRPCKCSPTVACGMGGGIWPTQPPQPTPTQTTTTTTTTKSPVTIPPSPSLCPQPRALNSVPVQDICTYQGLANVTTMRGTVVSCNAVVTMATVAGRSRLTFMTIEVCKDMIEQSFGNPNFLFEVQTKTQVYPVVKPLFNVVSGPNGLAFIDLDDRYQGLMDELGPCASPACAYNPATMRNYVDFYNCKFLSFGSSDAVNLRQNGLREVNMEISPSGCTTLPDLFGVKQTICFRTKNFQNVFCSGDSGAPMFCRSATTPEWILIGVAALQTVCDGGPEVKVIPHPG